MSKKKAPPETPQETPEANSKDPENSETPQTAQRLPVAIHAQYVKDISFENPNAPQSLKGGMGKPLMDINFSMDAKEVDFGNDQKDLYEVTLSVHITAKRGDITAYIIEIEYGLLLTLQDIPEDQRHPMLLIEMPKYAFPFVRQIIADMTQQAGYTPLLLAPVDFKEFYIQQFNKQPEQPEQTA